ncbi:MAG: FGGY-family carbohydrate kinase [Thermomicrobiales bacterium]
MAGELLLGVDVGTYSAKGVLCAADGDVLATHTIEHDLSLPHPGWAEHDADAIWWAEFVAITRALLGDRFSGDDVGAVGVSAIGPCVLPVDAQGRALRPAIRYGIDTRASPEIAWLNARFGEGPLFELGGMALTSQAAGPKILWIRNNEPDVYARTATFLSGSSYLVLKLTGERVIDRHSASYFNPLIDLRRSRWDDRFAEPVTDLARLPAILGADEIAGSVTAGAAAETGLRAGTPVTAGTIDAAAEAVSVGVIEPGDMMVMYGSTMFFILVTDRPTPDPRMWATAYCFPGQFDVAGGMATSGALTRWFRDQLGADELRAEREGGADAYGALAARAADAPLGSGGLVCLPYFSGERTPINDPLARGMFAGLTLTHTRAHLYRSMLEGTAYGVRHNLETMAEMGATPTRLVAVGGGAKNRLWLQIVSDVTGVRQMVPERTIGACYGDAFLAGLASGIVGDKSALRRTWVREALTMEPDPGRHAVYALYYDVYRRLYRNTVEEMHDLSSIANQQSRS